MDEQEVAAKEIKLENDLFMVEVNEMGEISVTDKKAEQHLCKLVLELRIWVKKVIHIYIMMLKMMCLL